MKKYLHLLIVLGFAVQSYGQQEAVVKKDGALITWEKNRHDFGNKYEGDKLEHTFYFSNTGNEPLIITNVQVSCDCTSFPKGWPRDPIPSGASGQITVAFNSTGKMGLQNKLITVVTNAVNPEGNQISFTTNIVEKKSQ
jgi:hypothetical protein